VLQAAASAWQKDGYKVIGAAIAGATAERLGADAKTDQSVTTDALLARVGKGMMTLNQDTVVVMDEAGMADTNRLSQLVERTTEKDAKLVLVGDSAQLSPIGAGGLFNHITDSAPSAELTEVHRAENQWEREAWAQVREGNATKALAAYQAHDRLHIADTREQAAEKMVADWNEQRMENPEERTVMLSDSSNEELDRLNKQAQEYRDQQGELGNDRAELPGGTYSLATGDQVIFTKPLYQPGQDYKAQGLTANNAFALIGGWQTDRDSPQIQTLKRTTASVLGSSRDQIRLWHGSIRNANASDKPRRRSRRKLDCADELVGITSPYVSHHQWAHAASVGA
jgi:ATP-dependent exoDNAse (exonuclease V) alpha subunit